MAGVKTLEGALSRSATDPRTRKVDKGMERMTYSFSKMLSGKPLEDPVPGDLVPSTVATPRLSGVGLDMNYADDNVKNLSISKQE